MLAGMLRNWNVIPCWWVCKTVLSFQKTVFQFFKKLNTVTIWPSNSTPEYISSRTENTCLHKNLYINTQNSIIHYSKIVQTTQISIKWWINKTNVKLFKKNEAKKYALWTVTTTSMTMSTTFCLPTQVRHQTKNSAYFHWIINFPLIQKYQI